MKLFSVILAVLLVLGVWHEFAVYASRDNPPVSCQFFGGTWNFLTGWNCNSSLEN